MMTTNLKTRVGDFTLDETGTRASLRWEMYHPGTGAVVAEGAVAANIATLRDLGTAAKELEAMVASEGARVKALHKPVMDGLSVHEAMTILDGWWFGNGEMTHPLLGAFPCHASTLRGRVEAILEIAVPPPAWVWAEGMATGLRVRCVEVQGADSYRVYHREGLLGEVPDHQWNELAAELGWYDVRISAVVGGEVGLPSRSVGVQVGEEADLPVAASVPRRFWNWLFYG